MLIPLSSMSESVQKLCCVRKSTLHVIWVSKTFYYICLNSTNVLGFRISQEFWTGILKILLLLKSLSSGSDSLLKRKKLKLFINDFCSSRPFVDTQPEFVFSWLQEKSYQKMTSTYSGSGEKPFTASTSTLKFSSKIQKVTLFWAKDINNLWNIICELKSQSCWHQLTCKSIYKTTNSTYATFCSKTTTISTKKNKWKLASATTSRAHSNRSQTTLSPLPMRLSKMTK